MLTATDSCKIVAILRLIGWQRHAALVYMYNVLLWYWASSLWSIDTCQKKASGDQYHVTILQLKFRAYEGQVFLKLTADQVLVFNSIMGSCQVNFSCCKQLGRVVWKPVNANPGLKINGSINLPCIRMFFTAFVLCILRLFKLKTECQTILRQKTSQQSYKTHSTYPGLA